jgi:hypothetical protein
MEVLGENRVDFTQPHMEDWIALGPCSPPSPAIGEPPVFALR